MWLSLPLHLVRFFGIDSNLVVRTVPYLAHLPLVILNDCFVWRVANRVIKKDAARVAMIFFFINRFQNVLMLRTLANSLEQVFTSVAFYYYLD